MESCLGPFTPILTKLDAQGDNLPPDLVPLRDKVQEVFAQME